MTGILSNSKPDIKFNKGDIDLNSKIAIDLAIKPGDSINLKEIDNELYLFVAYRQNPNVRGICKEVQKGSRHYRIRWKEMCDTVMKKYSAADKAFFRTGDVVTISGIKMLPIITRKNYAERNQV